MRNSIVTDFEKRHFEGKVAKHPTFGPGDTVIVHYKIREIGGEAKGGDVKKVRIQQFQGVVLRFRKGTADASFTVRKIGANGIGVERIFPLFSSNIDKIVVKSKGIVRRSRLYYLRDLAGKAARIRSSFEADMVAAKKQGQAERLSAVPETSAAGNVVVAAAAEKEAAAVEASAAKKTKKEDKT